MYNNDYMYAIERNDEYLAHYGVRGMKWGVRRALKSGNSARLSRQYAKASKKLAKLEKQAGKSKKYAKRAALLGAGAAAAGGLAAAGTEGVSRFMKNNAKYAGKAVRGTGSAMVGAGQLASRLGAKNIGGKLIGSGYTLQSKGNKGANKVYNAGDALYRFGNSKSISNAARDTIEKATRSSRNAAVRNAGAQLHTSLNGVSNNTIARIGAGAVGAGLAAGAARNAYKAATAKKKAERFRSEMNKAFAGTKYANGGNRQGKKRRRR